MNAETNTPHCTASRAAGETARCSIRAEQLPTIRVGGVRTTALTRSEFTDLMLADYRDNVDSNKTRRPRIVLSSNGQTLSMYHSSSEFRSCIDQADYVAADGMSIVYAARWIGGIDFGERVATTDWFHDAAKSATTHGLKFYLLGAKSDMIEKAVARARTLHPNLQIVGYRNGYFDRGEEPEICEDIVNSGADVLWLGLGRPHQERFAVENADRLRGVTWIRTCGGLFDFLSGERSRAPQWMQDTSLEWAYRMLKEPHRLAIRYLSTNPHALWCLLNRTDRSVRARRRADDLGLRAET